MIKFRLVGKFVNPLKINQQKSPHVLDRCVEVIEIDGLLAIVGAYANQIAFVPHHIDQFELLEERSERIKSFADFRTRFDGDTQWRSVVEDKAHECVGYRAVAPVRYEKIKPRQVR